ncbi:MAG: hypothetical protein K0Q50_476 [Vampirovibrio sp.]|jgi:hypothetical protein|nr:hypothetical protein [Vampirovibrio sp.]
MCKHFKKTQGQAIIEYTGAIVLSALIVAVLLGTVQQTTPDLFSGLFQNAEATFTANAPE